MFHIIGKKTIMVSLSLFCNHFYLMIPETISGQPLLRCHNLLTIPLNCDQTEQRFPGVVGSMKDIMKVVFLIFAHFLPTQPKLMLVSLAIMSHNCFY